MLGRRQVTDGKAGEYVWQTYEEVYQKVMRIGSAIGSLGVEPACNSQGICYVPLNDTLGANAVDFIMDHAEISIALVQESKIKSILAVVPKCTAHLRGLPTANFPV
ncbi:unnamed protein product [Miscanthus lutarioriparius]|uniref:Uncharacterized protein n=1 Tax=Miscanthus lutarioriparius TaxID=422564 RepID=A0A811SN80_9POAL|nr:unnamed protein product [Miscanthus lutarioriparius]